MKDACRVMLRDARELNHSTCCGAAQRGDLNQAEDPGSGYSVSFPKMMQCICKTRSLYLCWRRGQSKTVSG